MDVVYNFKLYDVKIEQNKILITFVLEFSREKEESKKIELSEEKPKEVKEETPQKTYEKSQKFYETSQKSEKKISLHRFRFLSFSVMNILNKKKEQFNNKIPKDVILEEMKKLGYSEEEINKALESIAYAGLIYFPDKNTISIVE
jgi:DNA replicative helicase MCM subunit Mcm2 (Cdc46/Mcm family)